MHLRRKLAFVEITGNRPYPRQIRLDMRGGREGMEWRALGNRHQSAPRRRSDDDEIVEKLAETLSPWRGR